MEFKVENTNLKLADEFAPNYDTAVTTNGWFAPDAVFNEIADFLNSGSHLLDIGIGTGLSSSPFKKAGCLIHGLDGSKKMLEICTSKKIAESLVHCDLTDTRTFPFLNQYFDMVISVAVFHLIGDLSDIFKYVADRLKKNGIFSFTVNSLEPEKGLFEGEKNPTSQVTSYKHSKRYLLHLLEGCGFTLVKNSRFLAYKKTEWAEELYFDIYITRKSND